MNNAKENKAEMSAQSTERPAASTGMIPVFIMGERYEVPASLTIMKAMEYAGFKFVRGCGCRGGICGACATVYRKPGDYKIYVGLACQTLVEPGIYLTQIPFYPANRASYRFEELEPVPEEIFKLYPELFRCVACNACTKVCPMDIETMDAMSALKQGNIQRAAELTFDCIQCGLCASRCFGELPQYHILQLARRMYGGKILPKAEHLKEAVQAITKGKSYDKMLKALMKMNDEELRKAYLEREVEPTTTDEGWRPGEKRFLLE
ncbi:4Fe-4S dicluster domain-containing protein [Chloroflexota bacterium]